MQRKTIPELLDTDAGTPAEVAASLADLRWLNRYFGGHSTTLALLRRVSLDLDCPPTLSYLDVAGASADGSSYAAQHLRTLDTELQITVIDRSPAHMGNGTTGSIRRFCGDALALPFADRSFDVVGSALFVHHLDPAEVVALMHEAIRVCRTAVVINDLSRSAPHYAFALAGRLLYRSRLTCHDAPVSVQRAYTPAELFALLKQVPASRIQMSSHYFFRIGAIVWR